MRKIAANMIFPVSAAPIKNGYVSVADDGTIVDVVNMGDRFTEIAGLEYYNGVLIPGFVNAHVHVELSHLKGRIKPKQGLKHFIQQVQKFRHAPESEQQKKAQKALQYMWLHGINGVGDISNLSVSFTAKKKSPILSHTFVELFNQNNMSDQDLVYLGNILLEQLKTDHLTGSLSPHSLYGVRASLFKNIAAQGKGKLASLHFFEHKNETQYPWIELLDTLILFEQILLVHNIFVSPDMLGQIKKHPVFDKIFWVFCPNSNGYIQNQLPNFDLFARNTKNICLGTDSLASNQKLCMLDEIKTVINNSQINFLEVLQWATLNGAKALNMDKKLGSFEPGKKPGVLLLETFDFKNDTITPTTSVKRLV